MQRSVFAKPLSNGLFLFAVVKRKNPANKLMRFSLSARFYCNFIISNSLRQMLAAYETCIYDPYIFTCKRVL